MFSGDGNVQQGEHDLPRDDPKMAPDDERAEARAFIQQRKLVRFITEANNILCGKTA